MRRRRGSQARNDNYGGVPAILRLRAALNAAIWGLSRRQLWDDGEIIVVDWNSYHPLRCDPRLNSVLHTVPYACSGSFYAPSCRQDNVRFIEVPPALAHKYAPTHLSEVHAFNLGLRRARGEAIFRLDQARCGACACFFFFSTPAAAARRPIDAAFLWLVAE